jgi:hypothetical protein
MRKRIEARVQKFGNAMRDVTIGLMQAGVLAPGDELAQPCIELIDDEAVERKAVVEQPAEGCCGNQRDPCSPESDRVKLPRLTLEDGSLAEPAPF